MKMKALLQRLRERLQKLKENKKAVWILGAGAALMAIVFAFEPGSKGEEPKPTQPAQTQTATQEERLCDLLSGIRGAGQVKVMITYASGAETVYAANSEETEEGDESAASSRRRKEDYVILRLGEEETGLVIRETPPQVCGVAVVCRGGSDPVLKAQIVEAVRALFNIKSTNISVAELATEGGASDA